MFGDINGDGSVNAVDASCILEYSAYAGAGGQLDLTAFMDYQSKGETPPTEKQEQQKSFDYQVVNTTFKQYKDYFGDIVYCAIIEIKNTGTCNIYLDSCIFDLEDNSGHLLQSDKYVNECRKFVKPGEIGYYYDYIYIDNSISLENGVKLVPAYSVKEAIADCRIYEVSDTSIRETEYYEIKVAGRVTNNSGKDDSWVNIFLVLKDKDGNAIRIESTYTDVANGATKSFEVSVDTSTIDTKLSDVASYEVIAVESYYNR